MTTAQLRQYLQEGGLGDDNDDVGGGGDGATAVVDLVPAGLNIDSAYDPRVTPLENLNRFLSSFGLSNIGAGSGQYGGSDGGSTGVGGGIIPEQPSSGNLIQYAQQQQSLMGGIVS